MNKLKALGRIFTYEGLREIVIEGARSLIWPIVGPIVWILLGFFGGLQWAYIYLGALMGK